MTIRETLLELTEDVGACDVSHVKDETRFVADLGFDSLDCVELVMELEGEFELEISDENAEKIETVGEAVAYLEKHVKKNKFSRPAKPWTKAAA